MDWIDEADGVFRGGGVKGLGLAGALLGMAEHPTKPINRWVNVAGASAGAIIAATLACGKTPADLEKLLRETDFAQFQDFPLRRKLIGGVPNLLLRHGLARGEAFRTWLSAELGGATFASVRSSDAATAGHAEGHGWRLKLIAADITFRRRVWVDDIDDLSTPMHYEVELIEDDEPELAEGLEGFKPAARRVLAVLVATGRWMDQREIGDVLANEGHPLKRRTILEAAKSLEDQGLVERMSPAGPVSDLFRAQSAVGNVS